MGAGRGVAAQVSLFPGPQRPAVEEDELQSSGQQENM